jgi:hypothetical protein
LYSQKWIELKSRWVAKAYHDFVRETGRSRITRPYHESDGAKLSTWMKKARTLRFIPADAILDEIPGENVFLPDEAGKNHPGRGLVERVCIEKNEGQEKYKHFLKPYALDAKGMAELDALEVYYPGGIAGFLEDALSKWARKRENPKVL